MLHLFEKLCWARKEQSSSSHASYIFEIFNKEKVLFFLILVASFFIGGLPSNSILSSRLGELSFEWQFFISLIFVLPFIALLLFIIALQIIASYRYFSDMIVIKPSQIESEVVKPLSKAKVTFRK